MSSLRIAVLGCWLCGLLPFAPAAQISDDRTISRYLMLLEKRPSAGTAFDRVYLHYKGRGRVDDLIKELSEPTTSQEATSAKQILLGMVYLREEQSQLAIAQLQRAAKARPDDASIDQLLAQAWFQQSKYAEGAAALESALSKSENQTVSLQLVKELVSVCQKLREPERAIQGLTQFGKKFPADAEVQNLMVTALIEAGRSDEAIAQLNNLIAATTRPEEQIKLQTLRADAFQQIGKIQEAVSEYTSIQDRMNPTSWQAEELDRKIRDLLAGEAQSELLESYLRTRIRKFPAVVANRIHFIRFLHRAGRHEECLKVAGEASSTQLASAELIRATIEPLLALERIDDVEESFRKLETSGQLSAQNIIRWGNLVMAHSGGENILAKEKATAIWEKLLAPLPGNQPAWQRRALLAEQLAKIGSAVEASGHYNVAIRSDSAPISIFQDFASLLFQRGKNAEAKGILKAMVNRDPGSESALESSLNLLKQFDQLPEATIHAEQLVQLKPNTAHRLMLAEALLVQGRFPEADQQLQILLDQAEPSQEKNLRQQVVDLLLKTDSVQPKYQQLLSLQRPTDRQRMLLASLAEVRGELTVALQTVKQLNEESQFRIQAMELRARLQKKAGQLQAAEQTFRQLAQRDRRHAADHSQSILELQLQMGRDQEAYQTAQAVFQQSPNSAASVSRYVAFLRNSQRQAEAISVLIKFLERQDTSSTMMVELADLLAEQFRSDEAMAWLWKAMGRSASEAEQRDIASRLVLLGLRTNQTDTVLKRLHSVVAQETTSTELHHALLLADAYRQARQLPDAVRELQSFLGSDSTNSIAITELVDLLSELNREEEALAYQLKLVQQTPNAEAFRRLGELLRQQTDITQYRAELTQVPQSVEWQKAALSVVDGWLEDGQSINAEALLDSLSGNQRSSWQFVFRRTRIALWTGDVERAIALSREYLETPPKATALLKIATTTVDLKTFRATDEAEARTYAWSLVVSDVAQQQFPLAPLLEQWMSGLRQLDKGGQSPVELAEVGLALRSANVLTSLQLREGIEAISQQGTLDADFAALSLLLAMQSQVDSKSTVAVWDSTLGELAVTLAAKIQKAQPTLLPMDVVQKVHQRLVDNGLNPTAKSLRNMMIEWTPRPNGLQLLSYWKLAEQNQDIELAFAVIDRWKKLADSKEADSSRIELPDYFGRSLAMFCSISDLSQRSRLLHRFLDLKAMHSPLSSRLADTNDRESFQIQWTEKTSHRIFESGRHVGSRNVVTLPAGNHIAQTDITFFVNLLHGLSEAECVDLIKASKTADAKWSSTEGQLIQRLATAHLYCLRSDFDQAILQVIDAASSNPSAGYLRVLISAYHAENGNALSALNLLDTVPASDVDAHRQALWLKLQIGNTTGQRAVAEEAAADLFGIRLTQDERRHLLLITERRQLDAGKVNQSRPEVDTLRPMEQLVSQMSSMQSEGQMDKAIEIANAILLTSDVTQHTTRLATSARRSAIQLLAKHGRLETALIDVNRRLGRNTDSTDLLRLKLQILKGMGRSADASKVQDRLTELVPQTPEGWIQVGQEFEDSRQYSAAANNYLKAFRVKPALLLADYYRYFKLFRRADRLPDLADLLIEANLRQLRDNYFVISELIDVLLAQSDSDQLGRRSIQSGFRLLDAAWTAFPSDRDYLLNNIQAKRLWESQAVVDYICDSLIPNSAQQAFARPWLGLDSTPVAVEGEGQLCPLQRVIRYLKNEQARQGFLDRVTSAESDFPNWLAGPYLEVALSRGRVSAQANEGKLIGLLGQLLDDPDQLPPNVVATNLVRTLRGLGPSSDQKLAQFFEVASRDSRLKSHIPFADSMDRLLAELQFAAGDLQAGRATIVEALRRRNVRATRPAASEAAWNHIHSVLAAVELLRTNRMFLDAAAESRRVTPNHLTISRGFQSNDSVDRACQRMWQQARQIIATAKVDDVVTYLDGQQDDLESKRTNEINLLLIHPMWGDSINWSNSELIMVLRRLAKSDPNNGVKIQRQLDELTEDRLSVELCRLAMHSQQSEPINYLESVQSFARKFSSPTAKANLKGNSVLAWCLVDAFGTDANRQLNPVSQRRDSVLKKLLEVSLGGSGRDMDLSVWKQCILHEAAMRSQRATNSAEALDAWQRSLDALVPPLTQRGVTDETSPLRQTRKLLLGP